MSCREVHLIYINSLLFSTVCIVTRTGYWGRRANRKRVTTHFLQESYMEETQLNANLFVKNTIVQKSLGETQTLRALAVVRFGHRPPAVTNLQTGPITIHCAAAS